MRKIFIIPLALIIFLLMVILAFALARPFYEYAIFEECQSLVLKNLKSPSSYKLISAKIFDSTTELVRADIDKYIDSIGNFNKKMISNKELSAHLKNVLINFDSKNPMNAEIRNSAFCIYGYTKSKNGSINDYSTTLIEYGVGSSSVKKPYVYKYEPKKYALLFPIGSPGLGLLEKIKSLKYIFSDVEIR